LTSQAALAAVDVALYDLWAQWRREPLWRLFGLDRNKAPKTSFTVALDTPEAMARRAAEACIRMPILKLKLGGEGERDEAMVAAVRAAAPEACLRVDANAGWTREQAAGVIPRLAGYDLELVEQPLPADDIEGLRWLREQRFGVPIFADESVCTARDVEALAGAVDGVVIKLMKCGGLRGAQQAIAAARAHGMQVMIGGMIESSVGATAAAHLSPLCDLADLDGPLLIADDPYRGVGYDGAQLQLPDAPGLGVVRLDSGDAGPHG
jgi:L-alanine-DL-glutamate epimerase-like enolase superfamily enzyme